MRFEGRELKPYAEPVANHDLRQGEIYFSVGFVDDQMLVPIVKTLVFLGRDLRPTDADGVLYFQDIESYRRGVRFPNTEPDDGVSEFHRVTPGHASFAFEYEAALDQLLACSLRRRTAK